MKLKLFIAMSLFAAIPIVAQARKKAQLRRSHRRPMCKNLLNQSAPTLPR